MGDKTEHAPFWEGLAQRNPALSNESSTIKIGVRELRRIVQQAEDAGYRKGLALSEELRERPQSAFLGFFEGFFGDQPPPQL